MKCNIKILLSDKIYFILTSIKDLFIFIFNLTKLIIFVDFQLLLQMIYGL